LISFLLLGVGFAFSLTAFLVEALGFVFGFLIAFFANFSATSRFCVLDKLSRAIEIYMLAWANLLNLETAKDGEKGYSLAVR